MTAKAEARVIEWDDSAMAEAFASVVNVRAGREQVELLFGVLRARDPAADARMRVALSNRITMTPEGAKRLSLALARVLDEYEARHGPLKLT